jgi:hypothetical protein
MEYQLVIQISANSIDDFDDTVSFEDDLIELLEGEADVDGHDFGSGQANIFIITEQPEANFQKIINKYGEKIEKEKMKIAYREMGEDHFGVLYPNSTSDFSIM